MIIIIAWIIIAIIAGIVYSYSMLDTGHPPDSMVLAGCAIWPICLSVYLAMGMVKLVKYAIHEIKRP